MGIDSECLIVGEVRNDLYSGDGGVSIVDTSNEGGGLGLLLTE